MRCECRSTGSTVGVTGLLESEKRLGVAGPGAGIGAVAAGVAIFSDAATSTGSVVVGVSPEACGGVSASSVLPAPFGGKAVLSVGGLSCSGMSPQGARCQIDTVASRPSAC